MSKVQDYFQSAGSVSALTEVITKDDLKAVGLSLFSEFNADLANAESEISQKIIRSAMAAIKVSTGLSDEDAPMTF